MTRTNRAARSRSALPAGLASTILVLSSLALGSPASAVPASVPSVNYTTGYGPTTYGWNYGKPAPSARQLLIGADTRTIRITLPFDRVDALFCVLTNAAGDYLAASETFNNEEREKPATTTLDIAPGRILADSGARYSVECVDGYADLWVARYLLTERAGAGATISLGMDSSTLDSYAEARFYGPAIFGASGSTGTGQTVVPGIRVRLYGSAGDFHNEGRINKLTVRIRSGSTTVSGLNISTVKDGSILGFTMPAGLSPGRVDFSVKTVATLKGTTTNPKLNRVTRWSDYAIYDPNTAGWR